MPYILPTTLLTTLLLSPLPALYHYTLSTTNLLTYESATKKASKITSEATRQLHKTRKTQAAALLSSLTYIISAAALLHDLFHPTDLPGADADPERRVYWHVEVSFFTIVVGGAADFYVSGFWEGARKVPSLVPGVGTGYNDAVRATESGLWWSRNVVVGWCVYAVYALTFQVQEG